MNKKLTYKILKEDTSEKIPFEFNREHFIIELKKEIGLPEISYEALGDFQVQLNSPTGRSSSFKINAKDYVDQELGNIERQINEYNEDLKTDNLTFDIITIDVDESQEKKIRATIEKDDDFVEWIEEAKKLEVKPMIQEIDYFKYFEVKVNGGCIVAIYNDPLADSDKKQDLLDQINTVKNHFATVGVKQRNLMTGFEPIISYYQWVNLVAHLEAPQDDILTYEDIAGRMDTVFEGVEGLDLPEGFV